MFPLSSPIIPPPFPRSQCLPYGGTERRHPGGARPDRALLALQARGMALKWKSNCCTKALSDRLTGLLSALDCCCQGWGSDCSGVVSVACPGGDLSPFGPGGGGGVFAKVGS